MKIKDFIEYLQENFKEESEIYIFGEDGDLCEPMVDMFMFKEPGKPMKAYNILCEKEE